ncbi:MAX dimerization protein MGA a isoform X2 [Mugil cephalus]|uniref:MAX dimerization protein MGA a isoform X2 n=1 Tax=Mugil cephalus TaxID=48193 RepID=UPI001FB79F6C|nr:MAX dimerization protein MGA a isoform X2 [Mugil cephalus]
MAALMKERGMVFHQDGATTSTAVRTVNHPAPCFATRPGKASERMEQSEGANIRNKPIMCPMEAMRRTGGLQHPARSTPPSENLSPDNNCKGIKVTLDNNSMWNEFYRCRTEMILTNQGCRMFPYCRFHISGLQPSRKYSLIMDIQPIDNNIYKWTGKSWKVAGKAEFHTKSQPFSHPESPATGQHWMQSPVSFYRLKLTNNITDQEGNTVLRPMHCYLPRLHVVQTDKAAKDINLNGPSVVTFTFPQTEFIAVTAYHNTRFAQLKVDYNPFSKGLKEDGSTAQGLKLKPHFGKALHKDRGSTTTEQHPVKKSLKSFLANHKPRSSKAVDSKPPAPEEKHHTTSEDQSAAKDPVESQCSNPRPAQKLISELIREAHVSLQRCNLEQLAASHTKTEAMKSKGQDVIYKDGVSVKEEKLQHLNSLNFTNKDRTDCSGAAAPPSSQNSSEDSDQCNPDTPSSSSAKQHRRPARLPLPALALFLKQHSAKSKLNKSKQDSPPVVPPLEPLGESHGSSDHTPNEISLLRDLSVTKPDSRASGPAGADLHPDKVFSSDSEQTVETAHQPSSTSGPGPGPGSGAATYSVESRTDDHLANVSEGPVQESNPPAGAPVLPNSDLPVCTLGVSTSTSSTLLATSSASPSSSPHLDTVLTAPNLPQTPTVSSTLPSDSPTLKPDSLLPDPECSSLAFEPLSPASSPEPLPPLPASLVLELNSTVPGAACKDEPPEDLVHNEDPSVFTWHTVLPPPEPHVDCSFTTFHTNPLTPLPSQTRQTEPQSLNTSTSTSHLPPSFQENEQSLPFPAELSPLALQLPLSPTFSSLDGDALSPTPSIADLVQFFSTGDNLGIGVDFSNTEMVAVSCPPPPSLEPHEPSQPVQLVPANKTGKRKKSRRRKRAKTVTEQKLDDSTYIRMQPNLEEVEEQLFISFTSKEALKLHIVDSTDAPVPPTIPDGQQPAAAAQEDESLEEKITTFQRILLRDLKLLKHRQVIHPVLQEVGLKMTLLDPSLSIDLKYLGVRMPIPPPGAGVVPLAQELPPSQGVSAAFVSRTGKTTDVTQIKGWRDKFSPSETPPSSSRPEEASQAGPSSDPPQKKNLSAFCSDMLDQYLENEGKLIDERAASFSQPPVDPPVYQLPTRSTSYVRTLDHVLKKQTTAPPDTDLISGFVPPSKRPRLKETKPRRTEKKQRGPRQTRPRPEPPADLGSEPLHTPEQTPTPNKRRKLKPRNLSQTLSPPRTMDPVLSDLAPLESDSELVLTSGQNQTGRPPLTRALLRQRDLEDAVVWEGRDRTSITEERATIALKSLFTLTGFVTENPTAPIQLARRRPPRCLNQFCRLGCVCSSLSRSSRVSHCGRLGCMFGCSCLKQKVVLLKNLDGSDGSPPSLHGHKKRRRRRRMKMAYVLKEADSVSQPAERVRTLWRRDGGDSDPEPVHVPREARSSPEETVLDKPEELVQSRALDHWTREELGGCARVRGFRGKVQNHKEVKEVKSRAAGLTPQKKRIPTSKESRTRTSSPPPGKLGQTASPAPPAPKPSKRLFILAECKWASDGDRNLVLKKLCEAMAQDRLDQPFWIRKYLIQPVSRTVVESGTDHCIQYKVHISRPKVEQETEVARNQGGPGTQREVEEEEARPPEDWQREVEEDIEEEEEEMEMKKTVMALPFLMGISPAGFLSATRKQPDGTDQLVQVNGKLYPLARIQLGRMGALHPANRLAAYLTGRVLFNRPPPAPRPGPPHTVPSAPTTAPSTPDPVPDSTKGPDPHKSSQKLLVTCPAPPLPLGPMSTQSPVFQSVLQPVQTTSRLRYYRRPDGKLFQLIPISQLGPVPVLRLPPPGPAVLCPPSVPANPQILTPVSSQPSTSYAFLPPPAPPAHLLSLKPSTDQGAKPGVKMVTVWAAPPLIQTPYPHRTPPSVPPPKDSLDLVSADPPAADPPSDGLDLVCADPPSDGLDLVSADPPAADPPAADPPSDGLDLVSDPLDLDVICLVDDPVENVVELTSSSETENSSDTETDEDQPVHRNLRHMLQERRRRGEMQHRFKALRRQLDLSGESKLSTLDTAVNVISRLKKTETELRMTKTELRKRRDQYLETILSSAAGWTMNDSSTSFCRRRDDTIEISSDEDTITEEPPPVVGGASHPPPSVQLQKATPTHPAVSHNAPVSRERPRTVPNILSRSRKRPETSTRTPEGETRTMSSTRTPEGETRTRTPEGETRTMSRTRTPEAESPSFQALVPAEVLSLVGTPLPRQPYLSLTPPPGTNPRLAMGVASVTLNLPTLTNQQRCRTSPPPPKTDQARDQNQDQPLSQLGSGQSEDRARMENQNLTSLLNEIVFLNQQTVTMATEAGLPSSSEGAGLSGHMGTDVPPGSANGNAKGGGLAPPPLLQMKVGGAKVWDPPTSEEIVGETGGSWRPMPRLVPLGLKGTPPS